MELEKIKELMDMMKANDLCELEIVDGDSRVMLKRESEKPAPQMIMTQAAPAAAAPAPAAATPVVTASDAPAAAGEENLLKVTSPIVGTFYAAPSPTAAAFIKVGDQVNEESVVCIVEAMKVMNEIKSEVKGTIKKVMVSNGQAVEYGQTLFLVEPD